MTTLSDKTYTFVRHDGKSEPLNELLIEEGDSVMLSTTHLVDDERVRTVSDCVWGCRLTMNVGRCGSSSIGECG